MTKHPLDNSAATAMLRLRRRAQPRTPKDARVNRSTPALPPMRRSHAAAKPSPATNNNAPAPKKTSAFELSPFAKAQPTMARAAEPAIIPVQSPRFTVWSVRAWSVERRSVDAPTLPRSHAPTLPSPANSAVAGCRACLRKVSQIVNTATAVPAKRPMSRLWAVA